MALPKSVDKLKNEGSKDDKVAVASSIAVTVVIVLFIGWGIFFLRNLARHSQAVDLSAGAQDQFNFQSVKDAQAALEQHFSNQSVTDQLDYTPSSGGSATMQTVPMDQSGQTDQFGAPAGQ